MALPDSTDPVIDAAIEYAARGWRVLPIGPGKKSPPMDAWQHAATTDPATITAWWTGLYRGYGIGIATGAASGLFVLDVDTDNGKRGDESLADLEATYGRLPDTREILTGSGGRHLYFRWPAGVDIRNDQSGRLGLGLDIRGEGGQVLAPPTVHPNGRIYAHELSSPDDLADPPDWLVELLTKTNDKQPRRAKAPRLGGDLPGDLYATQITWPDLLAELGATYIDERRERTTGTTYELWARPALPNEHDYKPHTSATLYYKGSDVLKVFTSNWRAYDPDTGELRYQLQADATYTRFGLYATVHHGGDMAAAARHLAAQQAEEPPVEHVAAEPDDPWPPLIPLVEDRDPPAFPIWTLPAWIADYAQHVADDLQVAPDLPAVLGLGALSVAALGNVKLRYPRQNWTQPLNLFVTAALAPSAGKSPAKNAMFAPLEELEQRRIRNAAQRRMRADSERQILEKRRRNLEDKAAKGDDEALYDALAVAEQLAALDIVPSGRLLADNATVEALGITLAEAGGNIAVVSAEGGIFDIIAGLYNEGGTNFDLYLEGWGGGRYTVDRVKRAPINVPSANLAVICTIQHSTLDEVGARRAFAGRGLTARFLMVMPPSNVGTRDRLRIAEDATHHQAVYAATLDRLAERCTSRIELTLAGPPSDRFAHWDQQLEHRCADGADLAHMREWVGKLRANVLRVAGLLHLADGHHHTDIDDDTVRRAIALGDYFLAHAQAVMDRWGADESAVRARTAVDWLRRQTSGEFTVRDLYGAMRRLFPTVEDTRAPLELLAERGWIRPLFDGPLVLGRRGVASPRFQIRPELVDNTDSVTVSSQSCAHARHARKGEVEHPLPTSEETSPPPRGRAHDAHGAQPTQPAPPPPAATQREHAEPDPAPGSYLL